MEFDVLTKETPAAVERALVRQAELGRLSGAYLEFGVYQGHSLLAACRTLSRLEATDVRLVGFDSFQGIPEPGPHDAALPIKAGMFACGRREVEARLVERGVDLRRVELVEGFYADTLTPEARRRLALERASVVLLDCDFYESTRCALSFVEPLLDAGAILIFDDWNFSGKSPERGQRRAFAELVERTGWRLEPWFSYSWHGQAFTLVDAPNG